VKRPFDSAAAEHGDRLTFTDGRRRNYIKNLPIKRRQNILERSTVKVRDTSDSGPLCNGVPAFDLGIKDSCRSCA
jgi:hypothetical protein